MKSFNHLGGTLAMVVRVIGFILGFLITLGARLGGKEYLDDIE